MAQLSNDCFAIGESILNLDQAIEIIRARVAPIEEMEDAPLNRADGRVLALDVASPMDLPPFDNSAVDGYAVRHSELSVATETRFAVASRLAAGSVASDGHIAGTAIRIFTGAPLPPGVDTVFMQEDAQEANGFVSLPPGLKAGANARSAGEDIRRGETLLRAGRILRPQDIALAAAVGLTHLKLRRRLRVAVLSTGNELAPGGAIAPGKIHDANRPMLLGMLHRLGANAFDLGVVRDARAPLAASLASAASAHDLILTTGGVSTGDEDHVKAAVEDVGRLTFWRIGIKPGRPLALGVIGGKAAFAGLPGNPVAAFVTFVFVVRPLIAQLSGAHLPALYPLAARAGFSYRKKRGRREYVRVAVSFGEGAFVARKFPREGAGVITSLTETDGLAEIAEDIVDIQLGDEIKVYPYAQLI